MNKFLLILFLFSTNILANQILANQILANQKTSISSFLSDPKELANIKENKSLEIQNKKIEYLKSSSGNTPFIEDIQLRYQLDDFTAKEHDFKLRISPRSWGETSKSKKLYENSINSKKEDINLLENKILRKRYKIVVKLIHYQRLLDIDSSLLMVYKDKVLLQKQNIGSTDFDIDELIKNEDKVTDIQLELIDIDRQISDLKERIGLDENSFFEFDTLNFINPKYISNLLEKSPFVVDSNNIHLKSLTKKYDYAKIKYDLEKSENRKIVNYIDVGYTLDTDPGKNDTQAENFTAGIGVYIPIVNSKQQSIDAKRMDLLKIQTDYFELKAEIEEFITDFTRDVKILSSQHETLNKRKKEVAKDDYFKNITHIQGVHPLKLLDIKESIMKTEKKIEEVNFEINKRYIELLDLSGKMSKKPLKNYLSTKNEVMKSE